MYSTSTVDFVDFSFIVSVYVSNVLNVTISTVLDGWILYGNMVDFSFIVSVYVSDLPNVTTSTVLVILTGTGITVDCSRYRTRTVATIRTDWIASTVLCVKQLLLYCRSKEQTLAKLSS